MARILLIGSGGREHALAESLAKSPLVKNIIVSPGNAGTQNCDKAKNQKIELKDVVKTCQEENIGLVVIGPEDPLAEGLADDLQKSGVPVFGPSKLAAEIESSKSWAKDFMVRHKIPTASHHSFTSAKDAKIYISKSLWSGWVIKASGLAAGKGVIVTRTKEAAVLAVDTVCQNHGQASQILIVEELLEGEEVSVLCFTDGNTISVMPPAQDHKQLLEGDTGPNTGGMGAYAPTSSVDHNMNTFIKENILQKAVDGLRDEGRPFVGTLFAGLILTASGPMVLEFNCRFGDPETQVLLPLLKSDLYEVMMACVNKSLSNIIVEFDDTLCCAAVCLVSEGYPGKYAKGMKIEGLPTICSPDVTVYHAGTAILEKSIVTSGGRVMAVVGKKHYIHEALAEVLSQINNIQFEGKVFRKDIASREIFRHLKTQSQINTYKNAGVNIESGNSFVNDIKDLVKATHIRGVMGDIGGFGGLFDINQLQLKHPILVTGADGVGTKLLISQALKTHTTIGEDLVAMCVNDILMQGATPLYFLDYLATGRLSIDVGVNIVKGIVSGCQKAECALLGGETAEMPGLYSPGHFDLAGFAVGVVEREFLLPKLQEMSEKDVLLALPSSGLHSNGFSLVRKILEGADFSYSDHLPYNANKTIGEELLTPTRIYSRALLPLLRNGLVIGAAHITGGGLVENLPRVLPSHLSAELDVNTWTIPNIFLWMSIHGVSASEMLKTFNLGIGVVLVVKEDKVQKIKSLIPDEEIKTIGRLVKNDDGPRVKVQGIQDILKTGMMSLLMTHPSCYKPRQIKKVAVLISGTGTNLQALIDHTTRTVSSAQISLVISNIPRVRGLERAQECGIPSLVIPHKEYNSRMSFEDAIHQKLQEASIDIVCLAGFMRILTPKFVNSWRGRMLNIHPSLLPAFKGMNAQEQALKAGVDITGCSVHFVSEEVDCGGIITQEAIKVKTQNLDKLVQDIKEAEHKAYPRGLEMLARGEVQLMENGKVLFYKRKY